MKMDRSSVKTLWIYILYIVLITGNGKYSEYELCVIAIAGFNATLEWELGVNAYEAQTSTIQVFNESGIIIAKIYDKDCEDSSIYCNKWNHREKWFFKMVLINVTPANTGRYTCQIASGEGNKRNITKELIVIDKPQIRKPPKTILDEPMNITCTVAGKFEGVKYWWKLNGTNLNSTGRIYANSSILRLERLSTVDISSNFVCEVCKENRCCIESETFVLGPYFSSTVASSQEHNKDPQLGLIMLGLVIVAVFLVIAGILMITKLRYYRNVKLGSRTFHRAFEEQVNNEACEDILSFEKPNRPLPIPPNQDNARRSAVKSNYPNIHQKSKSLQKLVDYTKDDWTPVRKSLSLKTLIHLSQTIGRLTYSDDSVINMRSSKKDSWSSMEGSARGIRLTEMYSKDRKDKKITIVEQSTGANSQSLNNPPRGKFEQEDLCNTKDEAAWLVYDYARASEHEENLREDSMTIEAENYHYDYAILPGL